MVESQWQQPATATRFAGLTMALPVSAAIPSVIIGGRDVQVPAQAERVCNGGLGRIPERGEPDELAGKARIVERPAVERMYRPYAQALTVTIARHSRWGGQFRGGTRCPRRQFGGRATTAAPLPWGVVIRRRLTCPSSVVPPVREGRLGYLGLLQADDSGLAAAGPVEQPRQLGPR